MGDRGLAGRRGGRRVAAGLLIAIPLALSEGCSDQSHCTRPRPTDWGCTDYREYLHFAASRDTPGDARDVAVDGRYVYIADGYAGFRILDARNPYAPSYLGSIDTPVNPDRVAVSGDRACVIGDWELLVIDVSDRAAPRLAGRLRMDGLASGVAAAGDWAVVLLQPRGLRVVDISNPESLRVVSSLDGPDGPAAAVFDGVYVRVAALCEHAPHNWTVYTIDLSDPTAPRMHAGNRCDLGTPYDIAMAGSLAYVANSRGLTCIDVADPDHHDWASETPISYGYPRSVAAANGYAYVADEWNGLRVFDVSVPSSPRMVALVTTYGYTEAVATAGNFVYVLDRDRGLHVLRAAQPPPLPARVVLPGKARDVAVVGERAYVAAGPSGLVTVDVADPMAAHYQGQIAAAGEAVAVASDGGHAYVACGEEGVSVIDVSDPLAPARVATLATPGEAEDVALADSSLCVAAGDAGLLVLGVSDPGQPHILSNLGFESEAMAVAVAESLAFVAAGELGLQIVNIADPRAPHLIGALVTPGGARDVAVAGDLARVADWSYGVQVVDISVPASPRILGTAATPLFALRVALAGATAYAIDRRGHMLVIDVSDPTAPGLEGTLDGADADGGVTVAGDLVYIAAGSAGLKIALAQCAR